MPKLSIVLLTFNRWDMTTKLLESLLTNTANLASTELVWIENGSADTTRREMDAWLQRHGAQFERVERRYNEENHGFIGGVNEALCLATGSYICLLNNDTRVPRDWDAVLCGLAAAPDVGAVGPVSNGMPFEQRFDEARSGIDEVPVVYGFCLVAKRELFSTVGLLDERYGRAVTEVEDWCERVRRLGLRFLVNRDLLVNHDQPHASFTPRVNGMLTRRNERLFGMKWGRTPYYWGREWPTDRVFEKTIVVTDVGPHELDTRALRTHLDTLHESEELLVLRSHKDDKSHTDWIHLARADDRLNVVCLPPSADLLSLDAARRCAEANARSESLQLL